MTDKEKQIVIAELLEPNSRLNVEDIALRTGLPAEEVAHLIEHMEQQRIIVKYKTIINWEALRDEQAYAFISVKSSPEPELGFEGIAERIYSYPEVHSLYLCSGDFDFMVVVEGRTMKEVAYFVAERLSPIKEVTSTRTQFVLKRYKMDGELLVPGRQDRRLPVSP